MRTTYTAAGGSQLGLTAEGLFSGLDDFTHSPEQQTAVGQNGGRCDEGVGLVGETYPYEELDGRRFQRLTQSLITAERPRTQCFTISGPDGGRDAVDLEFDDDYTFSDAVIFQVKFREQNPLGIPTPDDLYKWVIKNLKSEIPKLELLRQRDAREFIFVTNVPASGHLDTGLRDRVQAWAKENIPLPSFFWWREDVDARLDRHPPLVFKFMLFRGPDSVQAYLAKTLIRGDVALPLLKVGYTARNPAISTILLYLSRQYKEEESLRFKQAHVDAPLIGSFVDVPLALSADPTSHFRLRVKIDELAEEIYETEDPPEEDYVTFLENLSEDRDGIPLGAASALLSDHDVTELDRIAIEAGPGQGKSTLIQFLGQVHRARMLDKSEDLARLPHHIANGPLRLPFRIELRHLGKWLQGVSPWTGAEETKNFTGIPALHSYIAAHVQHVTGGMSFSSDDLIAIMCSTPTILLLDGLDEVADLDLRGRVVKTVSSFVQDMDSLGAKLQVVATGRPSSQAGAPSFQRDIFLYMKLEDLTVDLTERYSNSWIERRAMPAEQAVELRNVLAGCLAQPHVSDLARTPMQLAILLWLVHTRGWNLPDKRTALYDEYINMLLDREADKTPLVRKHREELLAIHGHLGWLLHSRSQSKNHGAGDIEFTELKRTIWEYLEAKEAPSSHTNEIVEGIRRIFILVDRIQGRFEFQVQPLREFFAARHLYKTAPYQTSAVEVTGSRPERLEALIRDPHWLNTARFFCGWYDVGELADLTQRLSDLWDDSSYRFSLHSRLLVAYLLSDFVSAAAPKNTRRIAANLTDLLSLRQILNAEENNQYQSPSVKELIPLESGLPVLWDAAKQFYTQPIADAVVYEMARLLIQIPSSDRARWWLENLPGQGGDRDEWIRRGVIADCLAGVPTNDLSPLFEESSDILQWVRCVESGRLDVATSGERMRRFVDALARGYSPLHQSASDQGLYLTYLTRHVLRTSLHDPRMAPRNMEDVPPLEFDGDSAAHQELARLTNLTAHRDIKPADNIRRSLSVRASIIGDELDDPWAAWRLALFVAPWSPRASAWSVNDKTIPLPKRADALWWNRSDASFWREQLRSSMHDGLKMAVAAALVSWAPGPVISRLSDELNRLCLRLKPWELSTIRRFCETINRPEGRFQIATKTKIRKGEVHSFPEGLPLCILTALELRMAPHAVLELGRIIDNSLPCPGHVPFIAGFNVSRALKSMVSTRDWRKALEVIDASYLKARSDILHTRGISHKGLANLRSRMDATTATKILTQPSKFPVELLEAAEESLQMLSPTRGRTLRAVAEYRNWFNHAEGGLR
ncbi:NACHT domain-containing protein [Streptomyces cyaneofuscatus]